VASGAALTVPQPALFAEPAVFGRLMYLTHLPYLARLPVPRAILTFTNKKLHISTVGAAQYDL
jgi:hypothetical protein